MRYKVTCKNLGIVGQIDAAHQGDIVELEQLSPDERQKLVDMGAVQAIGDDEVEPEAGPSLEDMTRKQLDAVASALGIDAAGLRNKPAVIQAIREAKQSEG